VDQLSCSLTIKDLSVCTNGACLFQNVNLHLGHKDKIAVIGPNGCGKTTLLKSIVGLSPISSGTIEVFHQQLKDKDDFVHARKRIGFLFQEAEDQIISPTVIDEVAFGLLNARRPVANSIAAAEEMLHSLDIYHLRDRVTLQLSGGEKKMVALASILIMEPDLLLLDEPSASLDKQTEDKIAGILRDLNKSVLMVSHNEDFVCAVGAERMYLSRDGLNC
jgi:cobalt/nickel transport system ATP-binding protein